MSKYIPYISVFAIAILGTLVYGFVIGGELTEIYLATLFGLIVVLMVTLTRKHTNVSISKKIIRTVIFSIIVVVISAFSYYSVNRLSAVPIKTYDAIVTDVTNFRDNYTFYFDDPSGNEKSAEYSEFNFLNIIIDENELTDIGDTIQVTEYIGIFDVEYCIVDEVLYNKEEGIT